MVVGFNIRDNRISSVWCFLEGISGDAEAEFYVEMIKV